VLGHVGSGFFVTNFEPLFLCVCAEILGESYKMFTSIKGSDVSDREDFFVHILVILAFTLD